MKSRIPILTAALLLLTGCADPLTVGDYELPDRWVAVSAGDEHTCAIAEGGRLWCWGRSATARLGFLSQASPCLDGACLTPVRVVSDLRFTELAAGSMHNCGVSRETAYCWGWGWWGQLGDVGTTRQLCIIPGGDDPLPCSIDPLPVALGFEITDVAAGVDFSCAVTSEGDGYCWGLNQAGQGGTGSATQNLVSPTLVSGGHELRQVSAGFSHACALDADGEIWCWGGEASDGRLGSGVYRGSSATPLQVTDELDRNIALTFSDVDAGAVHTCGVSTAGHGYCWGGGGNRTGDATNLTWPWPRRIAMPDSTDRIATISAGSAHSCAITTDGRLFCWGENGSGRLGDGSESLRLAPTPVAGEQRWRSASAGGEHTCAIDVDAQLWCWGAGSWGQLGNGGTSDRPTPVRIDATLN